MEGNYANGFRYVNMDRFKIENVSKTFLQLCR